MASAEDLIGRAEDALGGALGDGLALAPGLDVAAAELNAGQCRRLAANGAEKEKQEENEIQRARCLPMVS